MIVLRPNLLWFIGSVFQKLTKTTIIEITIQTVVTQNKLKLELSCLAYQSRKNNSSVGRVGVQRVAAEQGV